MTLSTSSGATPEDGRPQDAPPNLQKLQDGTSAIGLSPAWKPHPAVAERFGPAVAEALAARYAGLEAAFQSAVTANRFALGSRPEKVAPRADAVTERVVLNFLVEHSPRPLFNPSELAAEALREVNEVPARTPVSFELRAFRGIGSYHVQKGIGIQDSNATFNCGGVVVLTNCDGISQTNFGSDSAHASRFLAELGIIASVECMARTEAPMESPAFRQALTATIVASLFRFGARENMSPRLIDELLGASTFSLAAASGDGRIHFYGLDDGFVALGLTVATTEQLTGKADFSAHAHSWKVKSGRFSYHPYLDSHPPIIGQLVSEVADSVGLVNRRIDYTESDANYRKVSEHIFPHVSTAFGVEADKVIGAALAALREGTSDRSSQDFKRRLTELRLGFAYDRLFEAASSEGRDLLSQMLKSEQDEALDRLPADMQDASIVAACGKARVMVEVASMLLEAEVRSGLQYKGSCSIARALSDGGMIALASDGLKYTNQDLLDGAEPLIAGEEGIFSLNPGYLLAQEPVIAEEIVRLYNQVAHKLDINSSPDEFEIEFGDDDEVTAQIGRLMAELDPPTSAVTLSALRERWKNGSAQLLEAVGGADALTAETRTILDEVGREIEASPNAGDPVALRASVVKKLNVCVDRGYLAESSAGNKEADALFELVECLEARPSGAEATADPEKSDPPKAPLPAFTWQQAQRRLLELGVDTRGKDLDPLWDDISVVALVAKPQEA